MLSPDFQRLSHIRDYCIAIANTIKRYGNDIDIYMSDLDYQQSICFSILQIGELSGGLSDDFKKETADRVMWGPMKAMRNTVAHNYGNVDHSIVWETITRDIPALLQFCNEKLY